MGNKSINSLNIKKPNNFDNLKQSYFSFLAMSFLNHQNANNNYKSNKDICFKKNFKNCKLRKKIRPNIDWKTYLFNFFEKQIRKSHEFYEDIIDEIKQEKFGFENQYLSVIFFLDFENTYNSKNKDYNFKEYMKDDELDYEKQLKSRLSRNSSIAYDDNIVRSLIIIEDLPEEEINEEQNSSNEQKKKRKKVINLIKLIKSQIEEKNHPINIVISIFEKHISSLIENLSKVYEGQPKTDIEKLNSTIFTNIQKFAVKIHTAVKLFYSRVINLECFSEEKDELINVIMTIIFNTGSIYNKIFHLLTMQYNEDINDFRDKLSLFKDLKPKDIQIEDKFCLDENTKKLIDELKNKNGEKNLTLSSNIIFIDDKLEGYETAINKLLTLPKIKSPYKKMMLIASISTEITECVNSYWAGMENMLPSSGYLQVNSDELLKIFIFIVAHSQLSDLFINAKFVQNFTFSLTKSSMIGFYNSTLDAAINYIQIKLLEDIKDNDKIGINEELKKSIIASLSIRNNTSHNITTGNQNNKLYDSIDEDRDLPKKDYSSLRTFNTCKTVKNLKKSKNSMINFFNEINK
jgi:hypothetical protein